MPLSFPERSSSLGVHPCAGSPPSFRPRSLLGAAPPEREWLRGSYHSWPFRPLSANQSTLLPPSSQIRRFFPTCGLPPTAPSIPCSSRYGAMPRSTWSHCALSSVTFLFGQGSQFPSPLPPQWQPQKTRLLWRALAFLVQEAPHLPSQPRRQRYPFSADMKGEGAPVQTDVTHLGCLYKDTRHGFAWWMPSPNQDKRESRLRSGRTW